MSEHTSATTAPALALRPLAGWLVTALGFAAGLQLAGELPSPLAPLITWAGIALGGLLAGSSLPIGVISLLLGFELLRSLVGTGG